MTEVKVREQKLGAFEVSPLAALVPMANQYEQEALTIDIDANGQRDAIVLWKGKVVDGRCRQTAIITLGNRDIKYKELADELTEEEVTIFVKSVNTRRNLTATQKIMSACKQTLDSKHKLSVYDTAKSWGISKSILDNARYIAKHRPEMVDKLFNGGTVDITKKGKTVATNKVTTIYASVRKEIENASSTEELHAWSADSFISTQAGKEWFYDKIDVHKIENVDLMKIVAIASNSLYKLS